jgi:glycosyltransferase involved in cell wall biosynthesis
MIPSRDQATLLKAFRNVHWCCAQARLLLIGDGPQRAQLEQLARDLGIDAQTVFLGYREDIGDLHQAMDIYVNPTLDEGFGIAVVEAMLAGLPVVLAAAGAHPELIQDRREGFLYAPGDDAALADQLLKLIESPDIGEQVGAAARISASLRFSPMSYVQRYTDIIDTVLAVSNGRASTRWERSG